MHSTDDLEDGYFGSGKRVHYSVNKHGIENHQVEILEFLPSREELKKREAEVVNEELLGDPLCMNLRFGGEGGWEHVNRDVDALRNHAENIRAKYLEKMQDSDFRKAFCEKMTAAMASEETREKISKSTKEHFKIFGGAFVGKQHSEETKSKIGEKNSIRQAGENNSQYGTCWISHELVGSKRINKEFLPEFIEQGWIKGRNKFSMAVVA